MPMDNVLVGRKPGVIPGSSPTHSAVAENLKICPSVTVLIPKSSLMGRKPPVACPMLINARNILVKPSI
jgi:hypothetical protein